MRIPAYFSIMVLAFTQFLSAVPLLAADPPPALVPVCPTDTMDHLPTGMPFRASDEMVARAREYVDRQRDAMYQSHYIKQALPTIWGKKLEFPDGTAVEMSCTLTTSLSELETRPFFCKGVSVEVKHSSVRKPDGSESTPWRKFTFSLDTPGSILMSTLVCEVETTSKFKGGPEAPFEKTLLTIVQMKDLLFDQFMMQMKSDPDRCSAMQGNQVIREVQGMNSPPGQDNPSTGLRHTKNSMQVPVDQGAPASVDAAGMIVGPARSDKTDH